MPGKLAVELYARFCQGNRPTGIPVRQWIGVPEPSLGLIPPNQPPLTHAERNAIVLLVDQAFFDARQKWKDSKFGLDRLSYANRLTEAENQRLADSQDIHEILELLVKDLSQPG